MRVLLLYGGFSSECEVSSVSAGFIEYYLTKAGHSVVPIYIHPDRTWHLQEKISKHPKKYISNFCFLNPRNHLQLYSQDNKTIPFDIAFPMIHGTGGEDGCLQGLLEFLDIPYVGSGVMASSICMHKLFSKRFWAKFNLPQVRYQEVDIFEWNLWPNKIVIDIQKEFRYPLFIKPCNMGSSLGISKVKSEQEIIPAIEEAFQYDHQILIEEGIQARECELSILGNYPEYKVTKVGEIICDADFYSYDAKYIEKNAASLSIPAKITDEQLKEMQDIAKTAFRSVQGDGFARVDFFIDKESNKIYLNEINTLPGFTSISMFPKLWEHEGMTADILLSEIIELAFKKYEMGKKIRYKHKKSRDLHSELSLSGGETS